MREPSGDQTGMRVGSVLRDELPDRRVGDGDDGDVRGAAVGEQWVRLVIEGDALAVRRPRKAADRECVAGQRSRRFRGEIDDVEMRHPEILLHHLELAVLLLAILHCGRLRVRGGVRDALAVRRPPEAADAVLERGDRLGFATHRVDHVNLPLVGAVRHERDLRSVRRPFRRLARLLRVRQLPRRARRRVGDPDLGVVDVVVPVRRADGVGDQASVGRERRRAGAFERQNLIDGRRLLRLRDRRLRSKRRHAAGHQHGDAARSAVHRH